MTNLAVLLVLTVNSDSFMSSGTSFSSSLKKAVLIFWHVMSSTYFGVVRKFCQADYK